MMLLDPAMRETISKAWANVTWQNVWTSGALENGAYEGGTECVSFVPGLVYFLETMFFALLFIILSTKVPFRRRPAEPLKLQLARGLESSWRLSSQWLLVKRMAGLMLLAVFIIEVAYKVLTRKLLFLLQPCHIVTAVQIYLLLFPERSCDSEPTGKDKLTAYMMGWMMGPFLAVLAPDTSGLFLPYEPEVFWIQHIFIVFLSPILILLGHGGRRMVSMFRASMYITAWQGMLSKHLFHWLLLSPLGYLTAMNLNFMLCPIPPIYALGSLGIPMSLYRSFVTLLTPIFSVVVCFLYLLPVLALDKLWHRASKEINSEALESKKER